MGEVEVPSDAYYGASTQRAVLNFPISGQPFPRRFIRALGMVKKAAAQTNRELGLLGHFHEHQCQRGHRQSRHRDSRSRAWVEGRAPE
jgi:fumarate hydratase class II